jgi:predicted lipoprotein
MMKQFAANRAIHAGLFVSLVVCMFGGVTVAQKKKPKAPAAKPAAPAAQPQSDLAKLRDQYVKTTQEYKASLQRLLALYEGSLKKAEDKRDQARKLLADGLMSRREVEQTEEVVASARLKVTETQTQISGADTQIAQALVEVEGEQQIAKLGPIARGGLIRTTSFIRYNGVGAWALAQAPKIETFFQQTFKRPLPIAVFGQGAIHNQWRLDHRNAMDISLNPDGAEGQALINFLQQNGIPFSAFRTAIPGVATGPHIHIGRPSHRY